MRTFLLSTLCDASALAADPSSKSKPSSKPVPAATCVYRIPALAVTDKGTLIAFCEARKNVQSDWGKIDLLYRRSTDGGKTWSEPKKLDVGGGFEKSPVAVNLKLGQFPDITINNPAMIADRGVVHLLYCVEYMRCFYTRSEDDGKTFAPPIEITRTFEDFTPGLRLESHCHRTRPRHSPVEIRAG